ncbi:hypothetical protein K8R62_03255 [bacterium]|nr:hypothetical protein [bacterium]
MKNKKIWIWIIIVFVAILGSWGIKGYYTGSAVQELGVYDNFAQCLTEKGVGMGGSPMCGHCKAQKELFGDSFQYIDYHVCDIDEWCEKNNLIGYPSWAFPDGEILLGKQSLKKLSEKSGCELP